MSDERTRRYLVSYDISDDRRRTAVAHKLAAYGDRVQFSVFLVDVKPARFVRLQAALDRLLEHDADSLLICELGPIGGIGDARLRFVGHGRTPIRGPVTIL